MSKSVLVMDTPESCSECKIGHDMSICFICPIANKVALNKEAEAAPDWCPLKQAIAGENESNWDL